MKVTVSHLNGPGRGTAETFDSSKVTLGRAPGSHVRFDPGDFPTVSGRHAVLRRDGERWTIHDLGSTNGTYLNGERVTESVLRSEDVIELGQKGPKLRVLLGNEDLLRTVVESPDRGARAVPAGHEPVVATSFGARMKRVRGRLAIMLGVGFAVVEFVQILQSEYGWPRRYFNLTLIPTVAAVLTGILLAYFHGEPGRQRFTLTELFLLSLVWTIAGVLIVLEFFSP